MKPLFLFVMALITSCLTAHGQLTLNTGDSFTLQFSSLPFVGQFPGRLSNGEFLAWMTPASVQPGDIVLAEMFETSTAEAPICSQTWNGNLAPGCGAGFAWVDRQGTLRLTVLSGSVTLDHIDTTVRIGAFGDMMSVYSQTFVPVPEPSVPLLLGLGVLSALAVRTFRRSPPNAA